MANNEETREFIVHASKEDAFDLVTNIDSLAKLLLATEIRGHEGGELKPGDTWTYVHQLPDRKMENDVTFVEYEAPTKAVFKSKNAISSATTTWTFEDIEGGTHVTHKQSEIESQMPAAQRDELMNSVFERFKDLLEG